MYREENKTHLWLLVVTNTKLDVESVYCLLLLLQGSEDTVSKGSD